MTQSIECGVWGHMDPKSCSRSVRVDPWARSCGKICRVRAMVLHAQREPLRLEEVPEPQPGPGQVLLRVRACGVCRTDLHIVDGDLTKSKLPLIPGHQIVATVEGVGQGAERFEV